MLRRANLAFNLLPLIALLLCGMALFSFLNLNDNLRQPSKELASLTGDLNVMQQYIEASAKLIVADCKLKAFSQDCIQESARRHDMHLEGQGNFFIKIEEGSFEISKSGNFVIFKVPGVFIQSRQGSHMGQRNMDLALEADENGVFIKFINK